MQAIQLSAILLASLFFSATVDSLKAQTITHVPLYTFQVDGAGDSFGVLVSGAGDVNGDGLDDLIIGAPGFSIFGTSTGSGSAHVLSGFDGSVLYKFDGDSEGDQFGVSVSGAGDVNGDGKADLIIGASADDNNGDSSGSARVLSGSDGSVLYNFNGDNAGDRFGFSVSEAGDVNGDGKADLIVGASSDDNNGDSSGSARVLSGSDGSVLYNFDGDTAGDSFGFSVSDAGDVNGDGTPDLIVGLSGGNGSARVLSGRDGSVLYNFEGDSGFYSVSGAGDVNGDGRADLIIGDNFDNNGIGSARVLSGGDGSVLYNFSGDSADDFFGISVSGAGDVNGDGQADLIVGAFGDDNNGVLSGSARVLSGSDGSVLYNFDGDNAEDQFGVSVSGAGDVNGDGIDDFIVGTNFGGASGKGYARVFVSQVSNPVLLGDVNLDGAVNFLDISPFIAILSTGGDQAEADTNENGEVNFSDISPFIALLSSQ